MATAYTPGLTITENTVITKRRLLPIKGEVLVKEGDRVTPDSIVARANLPGDVVKIKVAERLGIDVQELEDSMFLKKEAGTTVTAGEIIAKRQFFFGWFKAEAKSPIDGTIEYYVPATGSMHFRGSPKPVNRNAYIHGTVTSVFPDDGVEISTAGSFIQGIFGIGREQQGKIVVAVNDPDAELTMDKLPADCAGKIIVGGSLVRVDVLREAMARKATGLIVGGVIDKDIADFLGYDIGVAITGQEKIDLTLVMTEGFGKIRMATQTFDLLNRLQGREASINGATQIRAGAQRPEIIVPDLEKSLAEVEKFEPNNQLEPGTPIRIIRVPYFGQLAKVTNLPPDPRVIDTGAKVRVLECELVSGTDKGKHVTVPRANVEILAG